MRNNIYLHLVFFILFLFLIRLKITTGILVGADNFKCIDKERDALLHFKAGIHHDRNNRLSTWTRDDEASNDCCQWWGVTCNNQTGHVISLDLSDGDLDGKISPSLLNLSYLNHLDLSFNYFNGTIPMFIGSMTRLRYLDLSYNSFIGTIPMFIGSMTRLRSLDLSSNNFNGTIPMFIGSMTQLRNLSLGSNDLTGTIPSELGNLTNLQHLSLYSLSNNCTIENLDWLSRLSQLEYLRMYGISLAKEDKWVNVILSLQKLSFLSLGQCDLSQVTHPYSYSFVNSSFSSSITVLYLGYNNLNSSMYHWLFPLTSNRLEVLDLSSNKLDGIPRYLGNLCSLRSLNLYENSIPIKFSDFLNNLSGCTSVSLQELFAARNQFTGLLSDDIQKFQSLISLDMSYNQLNGPISEKIWQLPKLLELDISSNSFNSLEVVPSEADMSNISKVESIDLSSNNFYGHLPNVSSSVIWLDLSKNKFYGGISFLCRIVNGSLEFLDLSNNSLSGQIPDCLRHFKELRVLNLGQNNLFGRLPASMKYLINLEVLYLYNNSLSGELPLSLQTCTNLTFLELGANKFSSYLPVWIGEKLPGLYALSLTSNNFFGTIPSQLCHLINLQILDLSMNNLHGTIPSCLNNITSMVQGGFSPWKNIHYLNGSYFTSSYVDHAMIKWQGSAREFSRNLGFMKSIDLSHNNLTGDIPYELTDLYELIALNLSMNSLHGEIPSKIGLMKNLLQLDLSRNHLSGRIPTSMSQMYLLEYMDVSFNNLSGRIPSGTQLQSFEPSRYIGNARLCGLPLAKYCPGDKELEVPPVIGESEDDGEGIDDVERWFYIGAATGFAMGFWTICSGLLLYRHGRHAFFQFMNSLEDWVYVTVMMFIAERRTTTHT